MSRWVSPAVGGAKKTGPVKGAPALAGAWRWNMVVVGFVEDDRMEGAGSRG